MNERVRVQKHIYQALLDTDLCGGPFSDSLARVLLSLGANRCLRLLVNDLRMSEEGARREIDRALQVDPLQSCESPIEKALMAALLFEDWRPFMTIPAAVFHTGARKPTKGDLILAPQYRLGSYRPDILVMGYNEHGDCKWLDVECDGDKYHNTTKAKWDEDQERDKCMRDWNIEVKRFRGRDIVKDAHGCAEEVVAIMTYWLRGG